VLKLFLTKLDAQRQVQNAFSRASAESSSYAAWPKSVNYNKSKQKKSRLRLICFTLDPGQHFSLARLNLVNANFEV